MEGGDCFETGSPVERQSALRTVLSLAARYNVEIESMDMDAAYLNAPVVEELFVELSPGCSLSGGVPIT